MKKFLFVLLAILLITVVAHAADDSDFVGEWTLKKIFFGEYGMEVNAADFGITGSLTITEGKITIESNGEISEAKWVRKSDNAITVSIETGESTDFILEDDALVMSAEDENGNITRMKFYKPGNTCNCAELQKQIAELTARIEALEAEKNK